jgi:hypothetical protein
VAGVIDPGYSNDQIRLIRGLESKIFATPAKIFRRKQ